MPAGRGDRRPGGDDRWQGPVAGRSLPQPEGQIAAVAQVPHSGHPTAGGASGGADHRGEGGSVVSGSEVADRIVGRVEGQVDMAVDEAGQDRRTRQVDDAGSVRSRDVWTDRGDRVPIDDDAENGKPAPLGRFDTACRHATRLRPDA